MLFLYHLHCWNKWYSGTGSGLTVEDLRTGVGCVYIMGAYSGYGTGFLTDISDFDVSYSMIEIVTNSHVSGIDHNAPIFIEFPHLPKCGKKENDKIDDEKKSEKKNEMENEMKNEMTTTSSKNSVRTKKDEKDSRRVQLKLVNFDAKLDISRLIGFDYKSQMNGRYIFDLSQSREPKLNDSIIPFGFATTSNEYMKFCGINKADGEIKTGHGTVTGFKGENSASQTTDALINGGYSGGPVVFDDLLNCGICVRGEFTSETIECEFIRMFEVRAKVESWRRSDTNNSIKSIAAELGVNMNVWNRPLQNMLANISFGNYIESMKNSELNIHTQHDMTAQQLLYLYQAGKLTLHISDTDVKTNASENTSGQNNMNENVTTKKNDNGK